MDPQQEALIDQARMLVQRLERISVDSIWSRRSSGHRGALLRWVERADQSPGPLSLSPQEIEQLEELIAAGYHFLELAAREKAR